VDVRIGMVQHMKDLEVEVDDKVDRDALVTEIDDAMARDGGVLQLTDRRGRVVRVAVRHIAFVEIDPPATGGRRVGFGAP